MPDHIEVDFTEVMKLADDFDKVAVGLTKLIPKAVKASAQRIKNRSQAAVRGRRHFAQAAGAISYDLLGYMGFGATAVDAEIGYDKTRRAGGLGNLIEYGAPNSGNQLSPGGELQAALEAEEDEFVIEVEAAVAKAMNEYWL